MYNMKKLIILLLIFPFFNNLSFSQTDTSGLANIKRQDNTGEFSNKLSIITIGGNNVNFHSTSVKGNNIVKKSFCIILILCSSIFLFTEYSANLGQSSGI